MNRAQGGQSTLVRRLGYIRVRVILGLGLVLGLELGLGFGLVLGLG